MAEANPFEDPSIEEASKARPIDAPKESKKKKKSGIDTMKDNGWLPKPAPISGVDDGNLPADWVQMRLANVIGVALMIITGLFNFIGGASISAVSLVFYFILF